MNLSYEEFMKIIPKETKKYVKEVLRYLFLLPYSHTVVYSKVNNQVADNICKETASFIEALYEASDYQYIAKKISKNRFWIYINGLKHSFENAKHYVNGGDISETTLKETFNTYSNYFLIYDNIEEYYGLTVLEIINNIFTNSKWRFDSDFESCFISSKEYDTLGIDKIIKEEKKQFESNLKMELFSDTPIGILKLIENASGLYDRYNKLNRTYFEMSHIMKCFENCNSKEDLIAMSIFMSYLTSNDSKVVKVREKLKLPENLITEYQEDLSNVTVTPNYYAIKKYYSNYFNNSNSDSFQKVFINLFNRDITNSTIVEDVLSSHNINKDNIIDIIDDRDEQVKINDYLIEKDIEEKAKELILNITKAYTLILEKMKDNKHNTKYLKNKNDAISLAYLLSDSYIYSFYQENGITYDKIFDLLKINVTKEEIKNTKVEFRKLKEFYELAEDMRNKVIKNNDDSLTKKVSDSKSKGILLMSIMLDSKNSGNLILKDIFNTLSENKKISDIFQSMTEFHNERNKAHKDKIYKELYTGLNTDTINYLKLLSKIDGILKDKLEQLSPLDRKVVAILYASFMKKNLKEFLSGLGLYKGNLDNFNNFYVNFSFIEGNEDDECLYDNYYDFIFNGYNKDIERNKLTPYHIFRNIFNKDLYDGTYLIRYLHSENMTLESFDDLDSKYKKFLDRQNYDILMQKSVSRLGNNLLTNAMKYNSIINNIPNLTDLDKEKISLILGYFDMVSNCEDTESNEFFIRKTLEKHNLTKKQVLDYLKIPAIDIDNVEIPYEFYLNYEKYLGGEYKYSLLTVMGSLFDNDINNSEILKDVYNLNSNNYRILQTEIITGKEYIPTLSECISDLQSIQVSQIDLSDTISVISYGSELSNHFKTINQEQQKILDNDNTEKSISTINDLVNNCYQVTEKKSGFLSSLFDLEPEKKEVSIKPENFPALKEAISENIKLLSNELLTYDKLKKYIGEYSKKNYEFLLKTDDMVKLLETKLQSIDPNNPFTYALYLDVSSQLQIIKNKKERFITSNQLLNQELVKINQMIVNHFLTINALETAKDDLLPLIGSELLIGKGIESEARSIELSKDVMDLFKALLYRNIDGAKITLDKLNELYSTDSSIKVLNNNVINYIEALQQSDNQVEQHKKLIKENDNKEKQI